MPVSPETLQRTTTNVTGCLLRLPRYPRTPPRLTWQVSPRLPHAPHRGVLRLLPACRAQERVVLQLGEAFGAAEQRAGTGCHPRGVWEPCQSPTTGAQGARVSGSSPLPDRRRALRPAVTNAITSPHHSPGLLPAEDRGPPEREAMRCPGPARLSYRGHQMLPPGEIWDERGGRSCIPPVVCARPRVPSLPVPNLPVPSLASPASPSAARLLESGPRRVEGSQQPQDLWEQSPQNLHLGPGT